MLEPSFKVVVDQLLLWSEDINQYSLSNIINKQGKETPVVLYHVNMFGIFMNNIKKRKRICLYFLEQLKIEKSVNS
jgi:hypothetical protein